VIEETLAAIYAEVLGLDRVGADEPFFELGGDSILAMQVVARARAAGVTCRPRDIFVEQTVAGVARVAGVGDGAAVVTDEGVGEVLATPIMRWLGSLRGAGSSVDQFNQSVVFQGPAGTTEADVVIVLQALLDRHAMLRLRVNTDGSLRVPEPGAVDARGCLQSVDVLSTEALVAARARLNPATGSMLSALWVSATNQLAVLIHHLAVDGVSWRILLGDLNIAWDQLRRGHQVALPAVGTSFRRWATVLEEYARSAAVVEQADAWRRVTAFVAAPPAVDPAVDTFATAGRRSVSLDAEATRQLLGHVPAALHVGVQDVLLIAFVLAWNEFLDSSGAPIGIDVEGHGRDDSLAPDVDLSRTVGWFTANYVVALTVGELPWPQVVAGGAALGTVIEDLTGQLRGLPDGLTYGLLRYLNPDVELPATDPPIGFNYLGRLGASAPADGWRICDRRSLVPDGMPLMHTIELNAVTVDTAAGPQLYAEWCWATSKLDGTQVGRLSQLWLDAVAGICKHVQCGGGGLTQSDMGSARLNQAHV
jgi:non-ribosomal peptide synthase protein (TIGR01720 family)